jgi:peptide/nickel transport system permease protein
MVSDGRNFLIDQWWISTFPGIFIAFVVLGFNLLGDGVRDMLDPRLRR